MNMGKLGVLELKDQCYQDLSGGQQRVQQRVLLGRALCAAGRLLILGRAHHWTGPGRGPESL